MTVKEAIKHKQDFKNLPKYAYLPPEGGWGYAVVAATAVMFCVTVVPMAAFGLVFGKFLASVGDETSGTTIINGLFNTVLNFTGLAVNPLLKRTSYRKVALMGSVLFFIGSLATVFVTSQFQMVISFGVIQGLGFGLMLPSFFTAMHAYFEKKRNVVMGITQALSVAAIMVWPAFTSFLMERLGFRGTVAVFSALSLNGVLAALALQPVERHMKRRKLSLYEACEIVAENSEEEEENGEKKEYTKVDVEEKLLENEGDGIRERKGSYVVRKPRPSIVSVGGLAASVGSHLNRLHKDAKKEELTKWQRFSKAMDLELFKDPVYLNISFGMSLSFTSDLSFIAIFPLILTNMNFDHSQITTIMTIFFASDLVSRILLTIVSGVMPIRNRYLFLGGTLLSAAFRIAFVFDRSFLWIATVSGALGFLRCFIQTPLPLVIAEEYSSRFATAFSLYMVICGVVSLICGPVIGYIKTVTQSDEMVLHALTVAYLLCGIPWTIELLVKKIKK